ncbi:hypothetical protein MTO96_003989 [Rhipicephalus appendiculatus]
MVVLSVFLWPPSRVPACSVSPRSSCLRTRGGGEEGGVRWFACPAGGGGRLGETPARQPAASLSPTSVVVVVARGDGEAAFVRPRVSVPPAEIGWNERVRGRAARLVTGRP